MKEKIKYLIWVICGIALLLFTIHLSSNGYTGRLIIYMYIAAPVLLILGLYNLFKKKDDDDYFDSPS